MMKPCDMPASRNLIKGFCLALVIFQQIVRGAAPADTGDHHSRPALDVHEFRNLAACIQQQANQNQKFGPSLCCAVCRRMQAAHRWSQLAYTGDDSDRSSRQPVQAEIHCRGVCRGYASSDQEHSMPEPVCSPQCQQGKPALVAHQLSQGSCAPRHTTLAADNQRPAAHTLSALHRCWRRQGQWTAPMLQAKMCGRCAAWPLQ